MKPLGIKNYGSIPHLPGSRMGVGDHHCHAGQEAICTTKKRDKHDFIYVQEKLDGSNVGVAKVRGEIVALSRAGYLASTSPYQQHHRFAEWVATPSVMSRFDAVLHEGERLVGEWLYQAHGTRYNLPHEPFVAFDLMVGTKRATLEVLANRIDGRFVMPFLLPGSEPRSVESVMSELGDRGRHGAIDPIEGAVWRVERNVRLPKGWVRIVDFLTKFVRPDKVDGCYLESISGSGPVLNTYQK